MADEVVKDDMVVPDDEEDLSLHLSSVQHLMEHDLYPPKNADAFLHPSSPQSSACLQPFVYTIAPVLRIIELSAQRVSLKTLSHVLTEGLHNLLSIVVVGPL